MADWKNEDDIKAELRTLTDDLKSLRQELSDMVGRPKQNPTRAFLHRQSWPPPKADHPEIVDKAPERPVTRRRRRTTRDK